MNIDYHVQVENCFYSVPYQLAREQVEVRISATVVEVFHNGSRVASHLRSHVKGSYSTDGSHRPASHKDRADWPPSRFVSWAKTIGPQTAQFVQALLDSKVHPEQAYRMCMGVISLSRRFPVDRMEAASARALKFGVKTYRGLKSILDTGADRQSPVEPEQLPLISEHVNLRGASYYQTKEVDTVAQPTDSPETQEHALSRDGRSV